MLRRSFVTVMLTVVASMATATVAHAQVPPLPILGQLQKVLETVGLPLVSG